MTDSSSYGVPGSSAGSVQQATDATIDLTQQHEEPSLAELLSATTQDLSGLMRSEVELAKVEIKEDIQTASRAAMMFGAAAILGLLALNLVFFAAAWGLSNLMQQGWAFLIVGVVVGIVAGVCALVGKKRLENFTPVPEQTVETIQEDVEWARQLKS